MLGLRAQPQYNCLLRRGFVAFLGFCCVLHPMTLLGHRALRRLQVQDTHAFSPMSCRLSAFAILSSLLLLLAAPSCSWAITHHRDKLGSAVVPTGYRNQLCFCSSRPAMLGLCKSPASSAFIIAITKGSREQSMPEERGREPCLLTLVHGPGKPALTRG